MSKIQLGDKVISDSATQNQGKVRLGDTAPVFGPKAGDKVIRDSATAGQSKVRLGDTAPVFGR